MILIKDHKARLPKQRALAYAAKVLKILVNVKMNSLITNNNVKYFNLLIIF